MRDKLIKNSKKITVLYIAVLCMITSVLLTGCGGTDVSSAMAGAVATQSTMAATSIASTGTIGDANQVSAVLLSDIPAFGDSAYVVINDNVPYFTDGDMTTEAFEKYSSLDALGRCGVAYANICRELMPKEARGDIGSVKPTGWHTFKYDFVDGKYLYNRCHLIGFQLAGENANERNLITGTRYMNVDGMLPFENMVADYVKETNQHVLYRVTPVFDGDNLVASGVLMEAKSVEDNGAGVLFNVYCYNNQPGVVIDYATGSSQEWDANESMAGDDITGTYVLNTNTKKFHRPTCSSVATITDKYKKEFTGLRSELINEGYEACRVCNP